MAPSPSSEHPPADEIELLLDLAHRAIIDVLDGRPGDAPPLASLPERLHEPGGIFVTLHVAGELNGCIGAIEGDEPLGQAATRLACAAAFQDPRLPRLQPADLPHLTLEVSLLSAPTAIVAHSWAHLVSQVRPDVDGLILRAGRRQGVFLPAVWDQLPEPTDFVDQLYRKAGFTPRSWPPAMRAERFSATKHARQPSSDSPV